MKNTTKRLLAVLSASILSVGLLAGCGASSQQAASADAGSSGSGGSSSAEVTEFTAYGVLDPQISAQQIIADKNGYFAEEGLTVTNQLLQSGTDISPLVSSGDAQVSFESTYTCISLAANDVAIKALSCTSDSGDTQSVVVRNAANIQSAADFEGKKIGISNGAAVMLAIRNMCEELDVDYDAIEFVYMNPSDQIAAFERGDIDAMACWEPWVSQAVALDGTLLFTGLNSYIPGAEGEVNWLNFNSTVQVTDEFLAENPTTCQKLLRALAKATDFINENKEEAAAIIAKAINQDEEDVLAIMNKNVYKMNFDQNFIDASNSMAAFMLDMGNITEQPSFETFADSSMLQEAVPELVEE